MSETLKQEPILISFLVSVAIRELAINTAWYGLATHQWNAEQLQQLQSRLESVCAIEDAARCMNGERIASNRAIEGLLHKRNHQGSIFSLIDGGPQTKSFIDSMPERLLDGLYPTGWFYFEQINGQRMMIEYYLKPIHSTSNQFEMKAIEQASLTLEKELAVSPLSAILHHKYLARLLLPALNKIYTKAAISQGASSLAATACALERYRLDHHRYPAELSELTPQYMKSIPKDPMSNTALKYRLNANNTFTLYSVGLNGVDEGGLVKKNKDGKPVQEEGDWVWQYPASAD